MGYQASCTIHADGKTGRGTAWLEHKDLVFRGPFRVSIPLKEITSATARGGNLHVRFAGREAAFEIGEAAAKWAARITSPPSRIEKLGIKPSMTVLVLGMNHKGFRLELTARGALVSERATTRVRGLMDAIFYAADRRTALEKISSLVPLLKPNGALWIVRPKGQQAITETDTMAAGKRAGLVDVKVVSFSETHTAEKFVIPVAKRHRSVRLPPTR